jgi:branched-chain amino acid transport system ATP-binding protein
MRGWIEERVSGVLDAIGLIGRRNDLVSELSHGEQRQLEIGVALATDPRLILLDEPAAGLSAMERQMMAALISSLPGDLSIVLIEHDMDIALELVQQVLVLDNGHPIAQGDPVSIRADQRVQDVYLKSD